MTTDALHPALSPEHLTDVLRRARLEPSLSSRRRQRRRATHRLEWLAHRYRHGRPRLHDGGALVPRAPAAAGTAAPRPLPLVAHGVTDYDRAALADDYRLSVLWQLTTPVWQAEHNLPPVIWWSHLERIVLAVDDLGGRDLLE